MTEFKHLFSRVQIGNTLLNNRILSTAHQTNHVLDGIPTKDMAAYHQARAKGGIGLIILEAAAVHPSGMLTTKTIAGYDEQIVDVYKDLSNTLHQYGTKVFSQLFHGGREVITSDYRNAAWAPSAVPSLRFGAMPKPMNKEEIEEVIEGFARSAKLAKEGGLDGVEICCSHGYLPSQFWSSYTNLRTDEYGGTFENRMRFAVEIIEKVWEAVGEDFTVGIRISADEMTMDGTTIQDATQIVEYLVERVRLDFIDVTAGDSSTYAGSTHIAPPSPVKHGYLSPQGFKVRMAGAVPVFIGSRILDPSEAEKIISTGKADVVGMTRAMITDPEMPNKAKHNKTDLIQACIGCLQACIGHYHKGLAIGCVQNPLAGKEEKLKEKIQQKSKRQRILIMGAGPAGLQAALTADAQGHEVILVEKQQVIGGMLNTLRKAPMRHEMAESMIDNFSRQLSMSNVNVQLGISIDNKAITDLKPDAIICAIGSKTYLPQQPGIDDTRITLVDHLFTKTKEELGNRTIVFDFGGDWAGIEAALYMAKQGCEVTLITARLHVGEGVHQYLRNEYMKELYQSKIKMKTHFDFGGIVEDKVIIRNLFTQTKEEIEEWDHIVLAVGRVPNVELYESIKHLAPTVLQIGDCLAPRTIEEATTEGLEHVLNLPALSNSIR